MGLPGEVPPPPPPLIPPSSTFEASAVAVITKTSKHKKTDCMDLIEDSC
jgi:hypothetical protein